MAAVNVFGYDDDGLDYGPEVLDPQVAYGDRDGTELIIALIVLGALGVLTGFARAGFRSVITLGR